MSWNFTYGIKGFMGSALLGVLAVGCSSDFEAVAPGHGTSNAFVSLSFVSTRNSLTRSNPSGGENGDGQETGQDYENEIRSAVAFFYKDDLGVQGDGTQKILAVVDFNNIGSYSEGGNGVDRIYQTDPQQVGLDDGNYHVLVLVNPHQDWWTGKTLTLADVRDHIENQAWTYSGTDGSYSDFLMTSAGDASLTLASNPETDPARTEVSVERMAARLDYQAIDSYTCTDPNFSGAMVEILGAALVNNLTAGSYLLKRVADDVQGSNLVYLGDETVDGNGLATNFVIDPWTVSKTADNDQFTINAIGGQSASALYGLWFNGSSDSPAWWADYVRQGQSLSDGTDIWNRIGYTLENVTAADEAGARYSTGVVFKARFTPAGVADYTSGETFFALGNKLYASMENMMVSFYGSKFNNGFSEIRNCQTWGDVRSFISAELLENDPSGYRDYLLAQVGEHPDDETLPGTESLEWSYYMLWECGYSREAGGKVLVDQSGKVTRIALNPYGVHTYKDATCYYTWWVRHCNDNDNSTKGDMEYAVVRNNIYKLKVNSIYSLGGDVPEKDQNIILDVYVNDWLMLEPENLPM